VLVLVLDELGGREDKAIALNLDLEVRDGAEGVQRLFGAGNAINAVRT
jgi:hypothetical protein